VRRPAIAIVLVVAACGARQDTGPAWPKSAGTEIDPDDDPKDDGGESIDPRQSGSVASVEASTGPEPVKTEPATPSPDTPTPPATDQPVTTPPTTDAPPTEPVLDEIIIEVKPD
jgi:hypothetical protein